MARKRHPAEQIIWKLREAEVALAFGQRRVRTARGAWVLRLAILRNYG
jgi:hypothetical protein